jgi:hypothetical protein
MPVMKTANRTMALCLAAAVAGLVTGCAAALCQPGEPSADCCIKKFPLSPVESCGASEVDALRILNGMKMAYEAAKDDGDEDDFANNHHLPEWKQDCIRNYVICKTDPEWSGPCYDCLRRCEGQQDWPFRQCGPPRLKGG